MDDHLIQLPGIYDLKFILTFGDPAGITDLSAGFCIEDSLIQYNLSALPPNYILNFFAIADYPQDLGIGLCLLISKKTSLLNPGNCLRQAKNIPLHHALQLRTSFLLLHLPVKRLQRYLYAMFS